VFVCSFDDLKHCVYFQREGSYIQVSNVGYEVDENMKCVNLLENKCIKSYEVMV